jgi:hypothetical protein
MTLAIGLYRQEKPRKMPAKARAPMPRSQGAAQTTPRLKL